MPVFDGYEPPELVEAAERFVSKMNENDLHAELDVSERNFSSESRSQLAEAIFDAFRQRGESSEDAAEEAGADLCAITGGDAAALRTLITYAKNNPGLLKEAAIVLIETNPEIVEQLSPRLREGIASKLGDR